MILYCTRKKTSDLSACRTRLPCLLYTQVHCKSPLNLQVVMNFVCMRKTTRQAHPRVELDTTSSCSTCPDAASPCRSLSCEYYPLFSSGDFSFRRLHCGQDTIHCVATQKDTQKCYARPQRCVGSKFLQRLHLSVPLDCCMALRRERGIRERTLSGLRILRWETIWMAWRSVDSLRMDRCVHQKWCTWMCDVGYLQFCACWQLESVRASRLLCRRKSVFVFHFWRSILMHWYRWNDTHCFWSAPLIYAGNHPCVCKCSDALLIVFNQRLSLMQEDSRVSLMMLWWCSLQLSSIGHDWGAFIWLGDESSNNWYDWGAFIWLSNESSNNWYDWGTFVLIGH